MISPSLENYLECIYDISLKDKNVRMSQIAIELDVTKASVNRAMGQLKSYGLVEQELYGSITLTEEGFTRAKEVARRHKVFKLFLTEILGISSEIAEEDACKLEHVVSPETMEKWTTYIEKALSTKISN